MAIEKMKFVNISGLLTELDSVLKTVAAKSEIHLENAAELFSELDGIHRFDDFNIYEGLYNKIKEIYSLTFTEPRYDITKIFEDEIKEDELNLLSENLKRKNDEISALKNELEEYAEISRELDYFQSCNVDMYSFFHLKNIKFRFGGMPAQNYKKIEVFLGDIDALIIPLKTEGDLTYVMYFVSPLHEEQVDNTLKKLSFKRIRVPDKVSGTPKAAKANAEKEIETLKSKIKELENDFYKYIKSLNERLSELYSTILYNYKIYGIRNMLAKGSKTFHITGFIPVYFAQELEKNMEADNKAVILLKEPIEAGDLSPPTKLRNNPFVKPFEMMVNMFSLPSYYEMDPTPFFAIAYSLLFGIMFADLGQGLVLSLGGFLLYKYKKFDLGGILAVAGLCSAVFGILFGSVFGNEELISPLLINPMHDTTTINETLLGAVAIGFVLIILAMIFNIVNAIRTKNINELFTANGIAGLIFYTGGGLIAVLSVINGHYAASLIVTAVVIILPLVVIFLKEPLTCFVEKKKAKLSGDYFAESFFELFESCLSYITNTMSFVRVGAFALNHIGMMTVVFVLAGNGGARLPVIVLGNIIVMAIEGLLVGIQVLRLMFFELFSKFYKGGGKTYRPFKINE